jgi:hypothetical protein
MTGAAIISPEIIDYPENKNEHVHSLQELGRLKLLFDWRC